MSYTFWFVFLLGRCCNIYIANLSVGIVLCILFAVDVATTKKCFSVSEEYNTNRSSFWMVSER